MFTCESILAHHMMVMEISQLNDQVENLHLHSWSVEQDSLEAIQV